MAKRPTATLVRKNKARGMMTWYARLAYEGGKVRHVSMRTAAKLEARRRMLDAAVRGVKEGALVIYRDRIRFLDTYAYLLDDDLGSEAEKMFDV